MVFTSSPDAPWSSYTPDTIPYKDAKLAIFFETQEMMEDSLVLLRFNCPDPTCDYIGNGWSDLKLNTRATHGKVMWYVYNSFEENRIIAQLFCHQRYMHPLQKDFRARTYVIYSEPITLSHTITAEGP